MVINGVFHRTAGLPGLIADLDDGHYFTRAQDDVGKSHHSNQAGLSNSSPSWSTNQCLVSSCSRSIR